MAQGAQGGGGFTVPEAAQELRGCGTEGRGLMGDIGGRRTVAHDDIRGFFQP